MATLSVHVIFVQILTFLHLSSGNLFLVVPENKKESCNLTTTGPRCDTLTAYLQERSIFSTPNSVWKFARGQHNATIGPNSTGIVILNATNITLTGEEDNWKPTTETCDLIFLLPTCYITENSSLEGLPLKDNIKDNFVLSIVDSSLVTLRGLNVVMHTIEASGCQAIKNSSYHLLNEISFINIHNLAIEHVAFSSNYANARVAVMDSKGKTIIKNCKFNNITEIIEYNVVDNKGLQMNCSNTMCLSHLEFPKNIKCITNDRGACICYSRQPYAWIGQILETNTSSILYSQYCPAFYCDLDRIQNGLTLAELLNNSDIQCVNGRTGLLCSQCPTGYAVALGGHRCLQCRGHWWILTIVYAIGGFLLVVLMFLFNLTILRGRPNGVNFYTNVLVVILNDLPFANSLASLYGIVKTFNFQHGSEVCFFEGMDEFQKSLVQFAFPLYLLLLVAGIVISAHNFNLKIFQVRFIAKRAVPVLATIMMLTYTDLSVVVSRGLLYTNIENVETKDFQTVWLLDPTIPYFKGRHLILAIISLLILIFYLLPFLVVTLFGNKLRRFTRSLWFSHFIDIFQGAYNKRFEYWLGIRLLCRALIIVLRSAIVHSYIVAYGVFMITAFLLLGQFILQPYKVQKQKTAKIERLEKHWPKVSKVLVDTFLEPNIFDNIFLFNTLIVTATVMIFAIDEDVIRVTVILSLSVSTSLLSILITVAYHGYLYFPLPKSTSSAIRKKWQAYRAWRRKQTQSPEPEEPRYNTLSLEVDTNSLPYSVTLISPGRFPEDESSTSEDESVTTEAPEATQTGATMTSAHPTCSASGGPGLLIESNTFLDTPLLTTQEAAN